MTRLKEDRVKRQNILTPSPSENDTKNMGEQNVTEPAEVRPFCLRLERGHIKKAVDKNEPCIRAIDPSLSPHQQGGVLTASMDEQEKKSSQAVDELKDFVERHGAVLQEGWKAEIHESNKGQSAYKVYISPEGRRFRSRVEVVRHYSPQEPIDTNEFRSTKRGRDTQTNGSEDNGKDVRVVVNSGSRVDEGSQVNASQPHNEMLKFHVNAEQSGVKSKKATENLKLGVTAAPSRVHSALDAPIDLQTSTNDSIRSALVTQCCRDVLRSIISAEKFGALSSILNHGSPSGSLEAAFQMKTPAFISDSLGLQLISLRLSTGAYGENSEMFSADIQQVWKNIRLVGTELVALSSALAELSNDLYNKQVLSLFQLEAEARVQPRSTSPTKNGESSLRGQKQAGLQNQAKDNNLHNNHSRIQKASSIAKAKQSIDGPKKGREASTFVFKQGGKVVGRVGRDYEKVTGKAALCVRCGKEDTNVLLCDLCDAAYHMTCLDPPMESVPDDWYCPPCADAKKVIVFQEDASADDDHHCAVCDRVNSNSTKVPPLNVFMLPNGPPDLRGNGSPEHHMGGLDFQPSLDANEVQEHVSILKDQGACKFCGERGTMLTVGCFGCGRCYHLSCLKPPLKKVPRHTWFCPSCLCRTCKIDADDDKILLCDGCDEGYHTYCLKPPLLDVPEGAWFCSSCTELKTSADVNALSGIPSNKVSKRKRMATEPRRSA